MSRFAFDYQIYFWEEAIVEGELDPRLERREVQPGLTILTPHLPASFAPAEQMSALQTLLDQHVAETGGPRVRWYYTPMMLPFSRHLASDCTVYDCMDELANFRFAPAELLGLEQELLSVADVVFTGGYSLFEAKRAAHPNVHPFPSSVDRQHFAQARKRLAATPRRDRTQPAPRLGFYGVLDERFDSALLAAVAEQRPNWEFKIVGPVVKISPEDLPRRPNIEYLGSKTYQELPDLLSDWDVALMPFAINAATRFISPTKTPEYLAAGKPVVSTPIRDVEREYGRLAGVRIAGTADEFVAACEAALELAYSDGSWLGEVDRKLSAMSWDITRSQMDQLIGEAVMQAAPAMVAAE